MNFPKLEPYKAARLAVLPTVLLSLVVMPLAASAASGTFAVTGSLNTARSSHTAILLQSGEVLVAGGYDINGNQLASAELYNPAKGTWSVTGSMVGGRGPGFSATLLPNGEVLVAGGSQPNQFCLNTAEIYNPSTGRWTATGSMSQPRCYHTATLLSNGEVLVAGGAVDSDEETGASGGSAELYNPSTGEWQATGNLNASRQDAGATLLANGQVLLAGGINLVNGVLSSITTAELYDPSSGVWSVTGRMISGVNNAAAVLLENNDVLIANATQFYNPASASWSSTAPLPKTAGSPFRATLLPNGNVLASGTRCKYSGCGGAPSPICFLYAASTNTWSMTGSMNQARSGHTSTLLLNGKVLVAGGATSGSASSVLSSAELYTP